MDEHINPRVTSALRRRGVDVLTAREAGLTSADDRRHLARAVIEGRVLCTQDVDFLRMQSAGLSHRGIVYVPQHTPIGYMVRGLLLIHETLSAEDMQNRVEYL